MLTALINKLHNYQEGLAEKDKECLKLALKLNLQVSLIFLRFNVFSFLLEKQEKRKMLMSGKMRTEATPAEKIIMRTK